MPPTYLPTRCSFSIFFHIFAMWQVYLLKIQLVCESTFACCKYVPSEAHCNLNAESGWIEATLSCLSPNLYSPTSEKGRSCNVANTIHPGKVTIQSRYFGWSIVLNGTLDDLWSNLAYIRSSNILSLITLLVWKWPLTFVDRTLTLVDSLICKILALAP